MDAITIITGQRTGAGHLFALLRNIEAVAPRDGLFVAGHDGAIAKLDAAEVEARGAGQSLLVVKATSAMPRDIVERELLGRTGMRAVVVAVCVLVLLLSFTLPHTGSANGWDVLIYAQLCAALARLVPGTSAAVDELVFHLERDADRWALGRAIDPDALASALRKATRGAAVLALGGSRVEERLSEILGHGHAGQRGAARWRTLAAALVVLTLAVAASAPPALAGGLEVMHTAPAHTSPEC